MIGQTENEESKVMMKNHLLMHANMNTFSGKWL